MKRAIQDIPDQTINFWRKRAGKKFSRDEAEESIANIAGFFQTLSDWNCKIHNEDNQAEALTSFHGDRRIRGGKRT